jgi:hypothetical protein
MRQRTQRVFLYLTGGLGNQLFQYAALEAVSYNSEKLVISNLGHPRKNSENLPEIVSILGDRIKWLDLDSMSMRILEKIVGLNLRFTVGNSKSSQVLIRFCLQVISSIFLSLLIGKLTRIIFKVETKPSYFFCDSLLLGYFQVSDYSTNFVKVIREQTTSENKKINELERRAQSNPLIIHVRRGDYLAEKDFGVLSLKYYKDAFLDFSKSYEFADCNSIWVFSDEIDYTRAVLDLDSNLKIEWFSDIDDSASLTLLAMSLGSNFIIANSTYSWWAAQLSRNPKNVYYPENWFKNIEVNERLFPTNWKPISNDFDSPSESPPL